MGEESERDMEKLVFPSQRPQFVLFGSSLVQYSYHTTEGWGATLSHLYARKADVILRGYAGWSTREALKVLDQVFPKDETVQPSLVIVHFGSEDSTLSNSSGSPNVPLQEYTQNIRNIANHLTSLSKDIRLMFLSTPPVNEDKIPVDSSGKRARNNQWSKEYSEALMEACQEMNILAIDLFNAMEKKENWQDCFLDDGVTLSAEGNRVVYKEILAAVKAQDTWTPNLYWNNMKSEFDKRSKYDSLGADGKEAKANIAYYAFPYPGIWDDSLGSLGQLKTQLF